MDIVEFFGDLLDTTAERNPDQARWLMRFGWEAMNAKFKLLPDRRLSPANQYLSHMMMDAMIAPLKDPANAAMVSIFIPCEIVQEVGLNPYNVEGFSCYVSSSDTGQACVERAEQSGIAETLCSYHKTFIGAAKRGLMPRPRCIVYTNIACDANMLTFEHLAKHFDVPTFFVDVPLVRDESAVAFVEQELRDMAKFLEGITGKKVDEDALAARVARSRETLEGYNLALQLAGDRHIPEDLVSPLYCAIANNILLGTEAEAHYVSQLLTDVMAAPEKRGKHLYWMHTIPYRSDSLFKMLAFNDDAQIVGCELGEASSYEFEAKNPYEAMARRLVYSRFNGNSLHRIASGIESARRSQADGVVWFNHWGCKHTIGISQLAKHKFEEAGIPLLVLDGDGVDLRYGGDQQMATRLGAFLEMLDEG